MPKIHFGIPMISSKLEDFKKVVIESSNLLKNNKIKILFNFETDFNIEVDEISLEKTLIKIDLDKNKFKSILNNEIAFLLEAILSNSEEQFIQMQINTAKNNKKSNSDIVKQVVEDKIQLVKNYLISDSLKQRYLIKKTTKHPFIKEINWEINKKLYDYSEKKIGATYATVTIKAAKELEEIDDILRVLPFMQSEYKVDEVCFDCDEYDINKMIQILENIKLNLENNEGECYD